MIRVVYYHISIFFGLAAAIVSLPSIFFGEWQFVASAVSLSIGLLFPVMLDILKSPVTIFRPHAILMIGLVYWLLFDLMQSLYFIDTSRQTLVLAFLSVGIFAYGVLLATFLNFDITPKLNKWLSKRTLTANQVFLISCICFIISFSRFAAPVSFNISEVFSHLSSERFSAPWARGSLGGWDAFLDHLSYFGYILPVLTVAMYRLERRIGLRLFLSISFSVVILLLLAQGGGRRIVGSLIISAGIFWVLTSRSVKLNIVIFSAIGVPTILTLLQYILLSRDNQDYQGNLLTSLQSFSSSGVRVDDNFYRLSQVVEIFPDSMPHVGFSWLYWILVRPVPRIFWPDKPLDSGFNLAEHLGLYNVNLTMSVVGEAYVAFGLIGVFCAGFVYGMIGSIASRLLDDGFNLIKIACYSLIVIALFVGIRSSIEVLLFSYPLLAFLAMISLFSKKM